MHVEYKRLYTHINSSVFGYRSRMYVWLRQKTTRGNRQRSGSIPECTRMYTADIPVSMQLEILMENRKKESKVTANAYLKTFGRVAQDRNSDSF